MKLLINRIVVGAVVVVEKKDSELSETDGDYYVSLYVTSSISSAGLTEALLDTTSRTAPLLQPQAKSATPTHPCLCLCLLVCVCVCVRLCVRELEGG